MLVVDDDDSLLDAVAEVLEDDGYAVLVAFSGEQAWATLHMHAPRPDILLIDLLMPRDNGWTLLQRIQADPQLRDIPVVLMSGLDAAKMREIPGAAASVSKPLETGALLEAMRQALRAQGRLAPVPRDAF